MKIKHIVHFLMVTVLIYSGCVSLSSKARKVQAHRVLSDKLASNSLKNTLESKGCSYVDDVSGDYISFDKEDLAALKNKAADIGGNLLLVPDGPLWVLLNGKHVYGRVFKCPDELNMQKFL